MSKAPGVVIALASVFAIGVPQLEELALQPSPLVFLAPSTAQAATSISLNDIVYTAETLEIKIPNVIVTGSTLSEVGLRALFDSKNATVETLADKLAKINAEVILIPELIVTQQVEGSQQVNRYFDVELRDVKNGIVGIGKSSRSTTVSTPTGKAESNFSFGETVTLGESSVEKLDTALAARLFIGNNEKEYKNLKGDQLVYSRYLGNNFRISGVIDSKNKQRLTVEIDNIYDKNFSVNQEVFSILESFNNIDAGTRGFSQLSSHDQRTLLTGVAGLLSSMNLAESGCTGVTVSYETGRGSKQQILQIDSVKTSYLDQQLKLVVDGINLISHGNKVSIGSFAIEDLSFKSTIKALLDSYQKDGATPPLLSFFPTGGEFKLTNLDVDYSINAKQKSDEAKENDDKLSAIPDRVAFSIDSYALSSDFAPDSNKVVFGTSLSGFSMKVPEGDDDSIGKLVRDLGYEEVSLSAKLSGSWIAQGNKLVIDSISLDGKDMGSFGIKAHLGQIDNRILSGDPDATILAFSEATLQDFSLIVENKGLYERIVKHQAAKQEGASIDEIKQQFAAFATVGLPFAIGETAITRKMAAAVANFAISPGKLFLMAKAKDKAGFKLKQVDFENETPSNILENFDITTVNK